MAIKDVSCRALITLIKAFTEKKMPLDILCINIPYTLDYLKDTKKDIEWHVFCQIMINTRAIWNDEDYVKLGTQTVQRTAYHILKMMASLVLTAKDAYRLTVSPRRGIGSQYFRCITPSLKEIEEGHLEITLTLPPGYQYCNEFFLITKGVFVALPFLLKLKQSKVIMRQVNNGAVYNIYYPKSINALTWLRNIFSRSSSMRAATTELNEAYEMLYDRFHQLEESQSKIKLQAKQLETAYSIGNLIRKDLNLDATIEAVSKSLIEVAGFQSVEVIIDTKIDGESICQKVKSGTMTNELTQFKRMLEVHGHNIGEITLWFNPQLNIEEVKELLDYIIPTISLETLSAISFKLVEDYRNKLEEKVVERTNQLNIVNKELASSFEKLTELKSARDKLFANISHEFRTPLTLILGPVDKINPDSPADEIQKQKAMIKRNAQRLMNLINQLLDLSKLEAGKLKLKASKNNIVSFVRGIVMSFESLAERKDISLKVHSDQEVIELYFDKDMMIKILTNLLSNAFKFTPEGGSIIVSLKPPFNYPFTKGGKEGGSVAIVVKDTGIGILDDELPKLFDRFYQVDSSQTREYEGSGLGLALIKELIELHHGSIRVNSKVDSGSEFIVKLPEGKDHLNADEIVETDVSEDESIFIDDAAFVKKSVLVVDDLGKDLRAEKKLVLLVEDNKDVREYIKDTLHSHYRVVEAANGQQGLDKAKEVMPDIIISDIMMPEMDGIEFCRIIKTEFLTSHIPVILLTAKASHENKIEGLETGADDYLIKPFDSKELFVRIKNLIDQRKLLKEKFSKDFHPRPERVTTNPLDDKFLKKAFDIVEEHLDDVGFDTELLAKELFVSRMQLHRKIQAITGHAPGEFIRNYRLKRAAEMLLEKKLSATQVAYEIGYNSPSHFSKAFIKYFNCSPSEYPK